jgi:hypothetical protein
MELESIGDSRLVSQSTPATNMAQHGPTMQPWLQALMAPEATKVPMQSMRHAHDEFNLIFMSE